MALVILHICPDTEEKMMVARKSVVDRGQSCPSPPLLGSGWSLGKNIKAVTVSQRLLTPPITPISLPHKNFQQWMCILYKTRPSAIQQKTCNQNNFVSSASEVMILISKKSERKFPRDMSRAPTPQLWRRKWSGI